MDEDREKTSSIEESEEEMWSEDGSTTDPDSEEIKYWESLTAGMLPLPAPLRLQCLLFIIGHLDEYGNEALALLPPRTRQTLLLNLPVIDVCKLEGSGVTEGIDMEEVWKTLYYNRLPTRQKRFEELLIRIDDIQELTWKDCYFSSLFRFKYTNGYDDDCDCIYGSHFHQDLLYGMYIRNGTLEVQECFGPRSRSCFGVETYARRCCRLTPVRYDYLFPDQRRNALGRYDRTPPATIYATIPMLVEVCKFKAKEFSASDKALNWYFDDKCFTDDYFPYWKLFLGSVRRLQIIHNEERLHPGLKHILDAIFCSTPCKLNELQIHQSSLLYKYGNTELNQLMALLAPYFSPTPDVNTLVVPYACLRKVHIVGAIQSAIDAQNVASILNHQNDLEVVTVDMCNYFHFKTPDPYTECLIHALVTFIKKSSFQELTLSNTRVPNSLALKLVHQFFTSHSTNHQQLAFRCVRVSPGKTGLAISSPPPPTGSRSLEITQCMLQPEITSAFPPSMSFRNLTLDIDVRTEQGSAVNVLDLFNHFHSLQVESMSLTVDTSNQNSKAIVNLLNLVDTRNWSLHFVFVSSSPHCGYDLTAEDVATVVDAVTDIAPIIGQLVAKGVVTLLSFATTLYFGELPESVLEALFEEIFQGLQCSRSEVELDLSDCQLNTSTLECLYHVWKRSTDVKLKKLDLSGNELPQDNSNLQQMTDKLVHTSE